MFLNNSTNMAPLRPMLVRKCIVLFFLQVHQRADDKWKDTDPHVKSLRKSFISNMLKVECCVNGAHSLDDLGLGACGLYQTFPGLDCTFPGLVFACLISRLRSFSAFI